MEFKSPEARAYWHELCRINKHSDYGQEILSYAFDWAESMERHISAGCPASKVISSQLISKEVSLPITRLSTTLLIKVWKYGAELSLWYLVNFRQ